MTCRTSVIAIDSDALKWRRLLAMAAAVVLLLGIATGPAEAENRMYLKCSDSSTDNDLSASSIGEELSALADIETLGDDNYSLVLSYSEAAQKTPPPLGGGTSDPAEHTGITVVRPVGASSPGFWSALTQGTHISECTLSFYRTPQSTGTAELYFTIRMTNVLVTKIEPRGVAQLESPGSGRNHLEAVTLEASRIRWRHELAGTSFEFNFATNLPAK